MGLFRALGNLQWLWKMIEVLNGIQFDIEMFEYEKLIIIV